MVAALTILRAFPVAFVARCAVALVEIALAAAIVSGSVVVGHALREWRSWYWAPTTTHPWTATPLPSDSPVAEPESR